MTSKQIRPENIVGMLEACAVLGLTEGMVAGLRAGDPDFPKPFRTIRETPLWDSAELRRWNSARILASARRSADEVVKAAVPLPPRPQSVAGDPSGPKPGTARPSLEAQRRARMEDLRRRRQS